MFFLFYGERFYPMGGALDFRGTFPTVVEAVAFADECQFDWAHITDGQMTIVAMWDVVSEETIESHVYLNMGWKTVDGR